MRKATRGLRRSIPVVVMLLFVNSQAQANYYTGYTDWTTLSPASKDAFVTGITDYLMEFVGPKEAFRMALASGTYECLIDQHISNDNIAEDVDRFYGDYVDLRRVSPAMITYLSIIRRCQDNINKIMATSGQPSLSFQTILHNFLERP